MRKLNCALLIIIILALFSFQFSFAKNSNDAVKKINNILNWEEKFGFSGSVLVLRDGEIILDKGFGHANKNSVFLNSTKTLFYIASVSKPVTAMGIMKLAEQNKIDLKDPVTKYFINVPDDKKNITIEMLLMHTSGLEHTYSCDNISDREAAIETILNDTPMLSAPGEKYYYSGDNYTLLAALIEIISGKSFENFIADNILRPSGIVHPSFTGYLNKLKAEDLASVSPQSSFSSLKDIKSSWGRKGRSGLILSLEDLYKIDDAFTSGKLLPENLVASMLSPKLPNGAGANYGYGFNLGKTIRDTKVFGHDGDDDNIGHNVVYLDYPQDNVKIFVAANNASMYSGTSISGLIANMIRRALFESDYNNVSTAGELYYNEFQNYSSNSVEKFEGVYSKDNVDYHVWINDNGKLILSPVGDAAAITFGLPGSYSEKNIFTRDILDQAMREDYSALCKYSTDNSSCEKFRSTLSSILRSVSEKCGPIEKAEISGTANIWGSNYNSDIATWFRLVCTNGSRLYRIEWDKEGKITGFGGSRIPYPVMFTLNAIAEDQFIGFDAANGKSVAVNFLSVDQNSKHMMKIVTDDKIAYLLSNTGNPELLPKRSSAELLYNIILTEGISSAVNKASEIKDKPERFDIDEGNLNSCGYRLLNENKFSEAIAIFTILVNTFPESANGFDSLGEAYMRSGDKTSAIKYYNRSLELDPNNGNAKKMIESMK